MASFLTAEQVEMLRDELTRLRCPNDPDQIAALRAMSEALNREDRAAFMAAWGRLIVGKGPRLGVCVEQFSRGDGGSADSGAPEQPTAEARNQKRHLEDQLEAIAPATGQGAARMHG